MLRHPGVEVSLQYTFVVVEIFQSKNLVRFGETHEIL